MSSSRKVVLLLLHVYRYYWSCSLPCSDRGITTDMVPPSQQAQTDAAQSREDTYDYFSYCDLN